MNGTLLFFTIALLAVEMLALRGLRRLQVAMRGRRGYDLATVVFRLVAVIVAAQCLTLLNAALIFMDRDGTVDGRVALFIVIEAFQTAAVLWVFREVALMENRAARSDTMAPPAHRREP